VTPVRRWTLPLLTAVLVVVALGVLWLGNTTAYEPDGRTRCGPAIQEIENVFRRVAGRCHLARQDRLRLGLRMATAMLLAGGVISMAVETTQRHRSGSD
jgi:hypothetical protein